MARITHCPQEGEGQEEGGGGGGQSKRGIYHAAALLGFHGKTMWSMVKQAEREREGEKERERRREGQTEKESLAESAENRLNLAGLMTQFSANANHIQMQSQAEAQVHKQVLLQSSY